MPDIAPDVEGPRLAELQTALEELRVAEEELRLANDSVGLERMRYAELFDLAPIAYLVTDAAGRIVEANEWAATLLDVPRSKLVDKPLPLFFHDRRKVRRFL